MNATFDDNARTWLEEALGGARLGAVRELQGATSSSVYCIEALSGSSVRRYVLRLLTNAAWLAREPDLAEHEAAALGEAVRAGLPAPSLIAHADAGAAFGVPAVLMSFLDGRIVLTPGDFDAWLLCMGRTLASIHRHHASGLRWQYRSWTDRSRIEVPAWSTHPQRWRDAIALVRAGPPESPQVFLHRDYHPCNVLWKEGRVSGIVDWINACRGPAGVDLAHCRLNLVHMYGADAAEQLLDHYRAAADGFQYQAFWDVDCILGTLPVPGFYPPWREHGLVPVDQSTLQTRVDNFLASVLQKT